MDAQVSAFAAAAAQATAKAAAQATPAKSPSPDTNDASSETETFYTPSASPRGGDVAETCVNPSPQLPLLPTEPSLPKSSAGGAAGPAVVQDSLCVPTFTFVLRRADNVPLGLDVRADPNETCLLVEGVRTGGAIEAWNKQCAGDKREIRTGDKIIKVNAAEGAEAMRSECVHKHVLKIAVMREVSAVRTTGSLRIEADEFVPQAHPKMTSSC